VKKEEKRGSIFPKKRGFSSKKEEKYRRFVFKPSNHKKTAVKLNFVKCFLYWRLFDDYSKAMLSKA
jgi:hypothetical protein